MHTKLWLGKLREKSLESPRRRWESDDKIDLIGMETVPCGLDLLRSG
jgi:hypothetical protein